MDGLSLEIVFHSAEKKTPKTKKQKQLQKKNGGKKNKTSAKQISKFVLCVCV
jgi:hypothetical protein